MQAASCESRAHTRHHETVARAKSSNAPQWELRRAPCGHSSQIVFALNVKTRSASTPSFGGQEKLISVKTSLLAQCHETQGGPYRSLGCPVSVGGFGVIGMAAIGAHALKHLSTNSRPTPYVM